MAASGQCALITYLLNANQFTSQSKNCFVQVRLPLLEGGRQRLWKNAAALTWALLTCNSPNQRSQHEHAEYEEGNPVR